MHVKRNWPALALLAIMLASPARAGESPAKALEAQVDAVADDSAPIAVYVLDSTKQKGWGAADGTVAGKRLSPDATVRIASNTKMFLAATVLRLWEQGRIDLEAPIAPLIDPKLDAMLKSDGYKTGIITVRQLLSHSAGLYDPGADARFVAFIKEQPDFVWTRESLIRLLIDYADPQTPPGTKFQYSDSGYILLGDIVERITGKSLAAAVREQLRFDRLGLTSTWWEIYEPQPRRAEPRSQQFLGDFEGSKVHASMDLFGGGGLIMSMHDLATLTAAIFEGKVYDKPATLKEMLWKGPHQDAGKYRLGVFVGMVEGREVYSHSGFWGTLVHYRPDTRVTVAAATTQQQGFRTMRPLVERIGAAWPAL